MRRCFIHIGTHKTGTTSIQHLLDRTSSSLLQRGYFYPQVGRPEGFSGQHNLAWEISGDYRFQNDYGTIDDLIREVKDRSGDVILSSEDFECVLYNRSKFSDFLSLLQSSGFLVTVILYVRNQIEYLPRIYLTLLHCGLDLAFSEALHSALDCGQFRWREWVAVFDYHDVLNKLGKIQNLNVIVRSYEQSRRSICNDFLSTFNLSLRDLNVDEEPFENLSLPLKDYLRIFLQNRIGRTLFENEEGALNRMVSPGVKDIRLSPIVRETLLKRFLDSNRRLFLQYDIPEPRLEKTSGASDSVDAPYVDELFLESIEATVLETTRSCPHSG